MHSWAQSSLREAIDLLARSGRADLASDLDRVMEVADLERIEIMRSAETDELADLLVDIDSISDLNDALERMTRIFEVDHCTFHVIRESRRHIFRTQVVTTYPKDWVERYVSAGFQTVDPVMAQCRDAREGFYWDALDLASPIVRNFMAEAQRHGIGPSGYTEIVASEDHGVFGVSVTASEDPTRFRDRFTSLLPDFRLISSYVARAFIGAASPSAPDESHLSDAHLKLLRAIAEGVTLEELRETDFRYGSFQTMEKAVCRIFGARTLMQAAVIAGRLGLLDSVQLTSGSIFTSASGTLAGKIVRAENVASLQRWARARRSTPTPIRVGATEHLRDVAEDQAEFVGQPRDAIEHERGVSRGRRSSSPD